MSKIKTLPSEVVDQISAGEVVERPAHMVKELVENAIDAGATEVEVEFDQGGRFVQITDNGSGMSKEDLAKCFLRHATSKISVADDLWALTSFGFRGEALASISAVSDVKITSRVQGLKEGWTVQSQFGKISQAQPSGGNEGTRVVVQKLFENTPARLKFLKSDTAEHTQIKNILKAIAMAHPEVSFRIRNKGKLLFLWASCDQKQRCEQVLEYAPLYEGSAEVAGIKAKVFVGAPNKTVKTARNIWNFVQGRFVQDRSLQAAVMDAYRSLLMHGEYPVAAIFVEAPLDEVDVNIHPTKSQVKFENASNAFRAVLRATRSVLEMAPWIEQMKQANTPQPRAPKEPGEARESTQVEMLYSEPVVYKTKSFISSHSATTYVSPSPNGGIQVEPVFKAEPKTPLDSGEPLRSSPSAVEKGFFSSLHVIGQAHLTYIVTQGSSSLILVDQHAAHERVMYEKLMQHWETGQMDVQQFLIPLTVDLDADQVEAIIEHKDDVERLGIEIDQSGPNTIALRTAPSLLKEKSLAAAMDVLGRELVEKSGSFAIEKVIRDICATMACHSVIRAGQALSRDEMVSLLEQMDEFPLSSFCPHGRPVYVEYPFHKIEKDFGRIV
ncbi:MAG: DNA mismatch repair endonuclease MutL [Bdellovibrionales bacterium]